MVHEAAWPLHRDKLRDMEICFADPRRDGECCAGHASSGRRAARFTLWGFDFIDLGRIRMPSPTVPSTIKSRVFSEDPRSHGKSDPAAWHHHDDGSLHRHDHGHGHHHHGHCHHRHHHHHHDHPETP